MSTVRHCSKDGADYDVVKLQGGQTCAQLHPEYAALIREETRRQTKERIQADLRGELPHAEEEGSVLDQSVPATTYHHAELLRRYMGLSTENELLEFLKSNGFAPFWEELKPVIVRRKTEQNGTKNPTSHTVSNYLLRGESNGNRKFSGYVVDKSKWADEDHYAYCLYRLKEYSVKCQKGIFFQKNMKDQDVRVRLWQCILLSTKILGKELRKAKAKKMRADKWPVPSPEASERVGLPEAALLL